MMPKFENQNRLIEDRRRGSPGRVASSGPPILGSDQGEYILVILFSLLRAQGTNESSGEI